MNGVAMVTKEQLIGWATNRHEVLNQKENQIMRPFAIDSDNNITAFTAAAQIPEGQEHFASEKELAKLAANWPSDRLIQIWNGFAGVTPFDDLKPIKKFTDRKTATKRIWTAIQKLAEAAEMEQRRASIRQTEAKLTAAPKQNATATAAPQAANVAPEAAPPSKEATAETAAPTAREGSKKAIILDLLRREDGATLKDIMAGTDWQAHSVRGFISGSITKKMGLKVESSKNTAGERMYKIIE